MESLKKLNHWLYQIERGIVVVSLMVMSVVVFLSVVHRRYADPESVLADKVAKLIGAERDGSTWQSLQDVAGPISALLLAGIVYLGFRTASRRKLWDRSDEAGKTAKEIHGEPLSHAKCAAYTAVTILVAWGLTVLLFGTGRVEQYECIELSLAGEYSFQCGRFPAGLAWAQPLGLILTLWVAFIGASMATKDNLHLKVEAVQQAMPEKIKRISGLLSGVLTAVFCLLLAYLGYRYVIVKHEEFEISNGLGGLHDGIDIPYYISFSIVPIAYTLMAARFVGLGVLAFRGELEETPAELRELKAVEAEEPGEPEPAPAVASDARSEDPPDEPSD
ncbi:TRAP transporter small permease, partial [Enhygromyxa salina]|uniref:TRAP transporter small permease n=1 Tax=Enhygromyxa salina TaxID=215803 RepID=UPI0011B1E981